MKRLAYIDWVRGLACVIMFQAHCYDSWLTPEARHSALYAWSQLFATLPAPLFLFLAGISFALVTEKLREQGIARNTIARQTILRGAEIFALGLLFRLQEYLLGYKVSPWTDLLRVDVLNIIGFSMMLMGLICWICSADTPENSRKISLTGALIAAVAFSVSTPLLWTTLRPRFLPWPAESYINGVHTFDQPQPWLFPLFPWAAFAFAGLAIGFFIFSPFAKKSESRALALVAAAGVLASLASILFDISPVRLYPVYDYWHTSPNFFLMRCGILLVILFLAYAWCRWGFATRGFSPLIQLGKTSLLVYWVHIEFVYGGLSIMPKRQCSPAKATLGLIIIFLAMLVLSILRTTGKNRRPTASLSAPAPAASG